MMLFLRRSLALGALCLVLCIAAQAEPAGQPLLSHEKRSFALESFRNCRDFGGLPVRKGYIKSGMLFRTPRLSNATRKDVKKIRDLQWRTVIDLRGEDEIAREGRDRLPLTWWWFGQPLCRSVNLPICIRSCDCSAYRTFLLDNPASIAGFFDILADPEAYPIDFHCSAGKDRTGIMSALLLEYLGTPRPIIYEDFLFSRQRGMEVHRCDLEEVFAIIDKDYHGVEKYLAAQGARPEKLRLIPQILTESGTEKRKQ